MVLSVPSISCAPAEQATTTTFEPITITGTADKMSETFKVTTKEWSANWSYVPYPEYPELAAFQLYIFPKGESVLFEDCLLEPEGTSGSLRSSSGAGEYYIRVVATSVKSWEVVISSP